MIHAVLFLTLSVISFSWSSPASDFFSEKLMIKKKALLEKECHFEKAANSFPISCLKLTIEKPMDVSSPQKWFKIWEQFSQLCIFSDLGDLKERDLVWLRSRKPLSSRCHQRIDELMKDKEYIRISG